MMGIAGVVRGWTLAVALVAGPSGVDATGAPRAVPERFAATYDVAAYGATLGETRWTLEPQGNGRFRLASHTRSVGLAALALEGERREESLFALGEAGRPRPLEYRFERSGAKAQKATIHFDWKASRATSRYRDRTVELPLAPGTLDALVYILALMQDLAAGRPEIRLSLAERGKIKTYVVTREGNEQVDTGLGPLDTLRVSRSSDDGRKTTVWCAPALGYLPARIEHLDRQATTITLRLRSASLDGEDGAARPAAAN